MKRYIFICSLLIFNSSLYAQWEILNEGMEGDLSTMDFVSEKIGWAAGEGTLIKTEDGGQSWFRLPIDEALDINWDIRNIDFVNDSVGWAVVGYDSVKVIKTRDAGHTWSLQYEIGASSWDDLICAVNDSVVYAMGKDWILKTIDGGESWQDVYPNSLDRYLRSIWFLNSDVGIVAGANSENDASKGLVRRTYDGGTTWDDIIFPEFRSISNLQFINDSTGFFLADNHKLCTTTDTLNTWSTLYISPTTEWGFDPIAEFHFLNSNTVYVILAENGISGINILKSYNRGTTWELTWSSLSEFGNGTISSNGKNTAFLFGHYVYGEAERGYGRSATALLKNTINKNQWTHQIFSYPFTDVFFFNKDIGILCGGWNYRHTQGGDLFMTNNSGKTWEQIFSPGRLARSCFFINDNIGFAVSRAPGLDNCYIYKTTDSGKNWMKIYDNFYGEPGLFTANDVWFINESIGWAVGQYGKSSVHHDVPVIFGTSDGGTTWDFKWDNYTYVINGLSSIHFINDSTGWAVGEAGLMVKYTVQDQWQEMSSVTDLPLNDVFFSDANNGWIAGGYSNNNNYLTLLLKTEDGGKNWTEVAGVDYMIKDIFFENNLHGWAVGAGSSNRGVVLQSEDGGESWTAQIKNLSAPLMAIDFKDGYGWAVGGLGLVLRTDGITWVDQNSGKIYPDKFSLSQNYPNPFNPTTTIKYQLKTKSNVQLTIYDISGREVKTLVDQKQNAGHHSVTFDASDLSSGIYIYRLKTSSGFEHSRKMVLLR